MALEFGLLILIKPIPLTKLLEHIYVKPGSDVALALGMFILFIEMD